MTHPEDLKILRGVVEELEGHPSRVRVVVVVLAAVVRVVEEEGREGGKTTMSGFPDRFQVLPGLGVGGRISFVAWASIFVRRRRRDGERKKGGHE